MTQLTLPAPESAASEGYFKWSVSDFLPSKASMNSRWLCNHLHPGHRWSTSSSGIEGLLWLVVLKRQGCDWWHRNLNLHVKYSVICPNILSWLYPGFLRSVNCELDRTQSPELHPRFQQSFLAIKSTPSWYHKNKAAKTAEWQRQLRQWSSGQAVRTARQLKK